MTSKEALTIIKDLVSCKICYDYEQRKAYSVIAQDLEVLEILKKFLEEHNLSCKIENESKHLYCINVFWFNSSIFKFSIKKEDFNKLKEWLENDTK